MVVTTSKPEHRAIDDEAVRTSRRAFAVTGRPDARAPKDSFVRVVTTSRR
jgi:hypothetical protein